MSGGASRDSEDLEQLELVGGDAPAASSKIQHQRPLKEKVEHKYKRQPVATGRGACRTKVFYARMRSEALEMLDEQMNAWLDAHPEVEVKLVTSSNGDMVFHKTTEPAVVITVWY